jgi:acetyl-CoA synthetase
MALGGACTRPPDLGGLGESSSGLTLTGNLSFFEAPVVQIDDSGTNLADRINDAQAKVLITADGGHRRGEVFPLKPAADEAIASAPTIEHVVVVRRGGNDVEMTAGRDHWFHDLIAAADPVCPAEPMDSEQLLFLLYTSGTTGKPKGIMHTTGGYLTQVAFTHKYVFDLHPDTDVFWCTADVGWVTGHSYILYGPLSNGATTMMFEGIPTYPTPSRFWHVIDKWSVNIFYTAPTAIRALMGAGRSELLMHLFGIWGDRLAGTAQPENAPLVPTHRSRRTSDSG